MIAGALYLLIVSAAVPAAWAGEVADTYRSAYDHYLAGDYQKAAAEYEYVVTLGVQDPLPNADLALVHRAAGEPQMAAAQWFRATLLRENDPFLWNARGWNYLALSRFREARDSFKRAVVHSTASIYGSEALFGLGLTDSIDGNLNAASDSLRQALARGNPYLRAAAEAELGRIKIQQRDHAKAAPYLVSSLSRDPMQVEVARQLGKVYEKTNQAQAAWQAFKFALDMSPEDSYALKHLEKMERYIPGNPSDSLPVVRLARPMMRSPDAAAAQDGASPPIRVAMFSGPDGRPRHLTKFYVMGSSRTILEDMNLKEEVQTATNFTQWEIVYRPDNRVIEIRDTAGQIVYVTKQPFRLVAVVPGHTVLIKNAQLTDIRGMDISDRELRGSLEILPTPFGFHLVNELPVDQYLFSAIGQSLPRDEMRKIKRIPMEAYKVVSLLLRSRTLEIMRTAAPNPERSHTCDSDFCLPYKGLTRERERATQAVRETRGMTVSLPQGKLFEHHLACGWQTADGIQDRPDPPHVLRHPFDLEQLLHDYPAPEQFSELSADVPQIWNRWVRVLDAEELRTNIERVRHIGPIHHIAVTRRDRTGRVLSLRIRGGRGEMEIEGADEIQDFLSPGSLRSTLFTLQPIYHGRELSRLVIWGAGTGHGRGLCIAGTLGQAHAGIQFPQIIRHYFPGVEFRGVPQSLLALPKKTPVQVRKRVKRRRPRTSMRSGPSPMKEAKSTAAVKAEPAAGGSKSRPPRKRRRRPPSQ